MEPEFLQHIINELCSSRLREQHALDGLTLCRWNGEIPVKHAGSQVCQLQRACELCTRCPRTAKTYKALPKPGQETVVVEDDLHEALGP